MFLSKKIAVVVPCYNEAKQITKVLTTIPKYVDFIVVVDDKSTDTTVKIVQTLAKKRKKIILIRHKKNQGVGGAIASGYQWCKENNIDIAVVMAGDGQMDPKDLPAIITPVATGEVDYAKANRLFSGKAYQQIPKIRYFGITFLSFLTKVASGYWHIMDSQSGYTAINKKMLHLIDWDQMYKRFGQPNDLLVRLNVYSAKVRDIPLDPVYNVGEKSHLKPLKVAFTIPLMLASRFFWRLKEKYIIRDFHPLVFFYFFGFGLGLISLLLFVRLLVLWPQQGMIPATTLLIFILTTITSIQFTLFAMWFDMEYNKELR